MKNGYISIVIPVYNAEKYIKKCIKSIQRQTYKKWKLIIVNDGSKDKSGDILNKYSLSDNRIIIIHQENMGCVEARKKGAMSEEARKNEFVLFVDADDDLPCDALEKLYSLANSYNADIVCGDMKRMFKGIKLPKQSKAPCFQISEPTVYTHNEIISKLFVSFFGISNFPVTLWGKLYKTNLLLDSIDFKPIVKFTGEDLSVCIRVLSKAERCVITPDIVYYYRMGGGTSKFMPYMMDDFLNLYHYKKGFGEKYQMPQDWKLYMNIELLNCCKSYIQQCIKYKDSSNIDVRKEVEKICEMTTIREVAESLHSIDEINSEFAKMIIDKKVDEIIMENQRIVYSNRMRDRLKKLLLKL